MNKPNTLQEKIDYLEQFIEETNLSPKHVQVIRDAIELLTKGIDVDLMTIEVSEFHK